MIDLMGLAQRMSFILMFISMQITTVQMLNKDLSPTAVNPLLSNNLSIATTNSIHTEVSSSSKSISTRKKLAKTSSTMTPYALAHRLVDQFNRYRQAEIVSRIKSCDANMKLNEICEMYSLDNHTYSLIRESNVEFQSLQHIFDALVDRFFVEKLINRCSPASWCVNNLTQADIRFSVNIIRQRGRSFCSLADCQQRLAVQIESCPTLIARNLSEPTLKLLPMLCSLYEEPSNWNTTICERDLVYLLHLLYAFWSDLENCYNIIVVGTDGACASECLVFNELLHRVKNNCPSNASFLSRVPTLAWYRLANLKEICRHETVGARVPFISSVKNFISSNVIWYRFHERPIYSIIFIGLVLVIVISFSLCLYAMGKNQLDPDSRRLDDDYEYRRLHDTSFELGTSTEIPNGNGPSVDRNLRSAEHQRLLYFDS